MEDGGASFEQPSREHLSQAETLATPGELTFVCVGCPYRRRY